MLIRVYTGEAEKDAAEIEEILLSQWQISLTQSDQLTYLTIAM